MSLESIQNFFSTADFMPHIHCYLAKPSLVWTMATTDTLIGLSYVSISTSLYFLLKKIKVPFSMMLTCFGLFIFACGITHFIEVYTLWTPAYWAAAFMKVVTAFASVLTAIYLVKISPQVIAMLKQASESEKYKLELFKQTQVLTKALEDLNDTQDRFRLMVEGVKDYAIFMLDPEGRIQTWNAGAKHLKYYDSDEIIGKHFSIFYTEEDLEKHVPEAELKVARVSGYFENEGWRVRKGGEKFYANGVITRLNNKAGECIGFSKITRDLTERKAAERALILMNESLEKRVIERTEELRESEVRFQAFANSMAQLAWIARADGYVTWFNKGWYEYTGSKIESADGWQWISLCEPEAVSRISVEWKHAIATQQPLETTFKLKGIDGNYRWFITRVIPIFNSSGELTRWYGTSTNIDEQMNLQDELRVAIQGRDNFLSVASHELKTPLTSLYMELQLLQAKAKENVDPSKLVTCINQSEKLIRLIDELLDLTRIRGGKLLLDISEVELISLISNLISSLEVQLKFQNRKINFHYDGLSSVYGNWDGLRIEQVMTNLISNSIKYGGDKDIDIRLMVDSAKDEVRIQVTDQGIGIPAELHKKIFMRFARESYDNRIAGLGLGLYITNELVEGHGGKIELRSEIGEGATFTVILPVHAVQKLTKVV